MKTLIIYASKYGCTQKCAKSLAKKLSGDVELSNIKQGKTYDLSQYDKVIIEGSIYMGKIQKEISDFCSENLSILRNKKIGLFICGMQKEETLEAELAGAFPEQLVVQAVGKEVLGGEFILKKLTFLERFIVKKVSKIDKDTSIIREENIDKLAQSVNNS